MIEAENSMCKIVSEDGQDYYLSTAFHLDGVSGIDIALFDGTNAWALSVTPHDVKKMAQKIKMEVADFAAQTRKALTRENMCSFNFLYQVKPVADGQMQLIWRKYLAAEGVKFQLGSVDLKLTPNSTEFIRSCFDRAIETSASLKAEITSLQTDCQRLSAERANALKRLEKCVAAKEELENDLYSKFVAVVNSKKDKIRSLREELETLEAEGPSRLAESAGPSTSRAVRHPSSSRGGSESGDSLVVKVKRSDTDSEYHTDEEDMEKKSHEPVVRAKRPRRGNPVEEDDGLMLDSSQDISPEPKGRRRRRAAMAKKQTPSKPVIPKVPSSEQKEKPSRDSRRGSMIRKSSSGASNRSSDLIDPEDLIGDM